MTHDEAIEILTDLHIDTYLTKVDLEAINYSIKQHKQCEVYTKPIEMEVSNSKNLNFVNYRIVNGVFNKKYVADDDILYSHARPIKKEPLSFGEWVKRINKIAIVSSNNLDKYYSEYQSYLKDFEK